MPKVAKKARAKIKSFVDEWKEAYGCTITQWLDEDYVNNYLRHIDYSLEVRPIIHTTNSIDRQIRKISKTKFSFEQKQNLLDLIFMIIKDFEANNWQQYAVINFQYLINKYN
ncbi:MAG: transposase [Bacteroidota bacterium]